MPYPRFHDRITTKLANLREGGWRALTTASWAQVDTAFRKELEECNLVEPLCFHEILREVLDEQDVTVAAVVQVALAVVTARELWVEANAGQIQAAISGICVLMEADAEARARRDRSKIVREFKLAKFERVFDLELLDAPEYALAWLLGIRPGRTKLEKVENGWGAQDLWTRQIGDDLRAFRKHWTERQYDPTIRDHGGDRRIRGGLPDWTDEKTAEISKRIAAQFKACRCADEYRRQLNAELRISVKQQEGLRSLPPDRQAAAIEEAAEAVRKKKAGNARKKVERCLREHWLLAWDGSIALWPFRRRAICGSFAPGEKYKMFPGSMSYPTLEKEVGLSVATVRARYCPRCIRKLLIRYCRRVLESESKGPFRRLQEDDYERLRKLGLDKGKEGFEVPAEIRELLDAESADQPLTPTELSRVRRWLQDLREAKKRWKWGVEVPRLPFTPCVGDRCTHWFPVLRGDGRSRQFERDPCSYAFGPMDRFGEAKDQLINRTLWRAAEAWNCLCGSIHLRDEVCGPRL